MSAYSTLIEAESGLLFFTPLDAEFGAVDRGPLAKTVTAQGGATAGGATGPGDLTLADLDGSNDYYSTNWDSSAAAGSRPFENGTVRTFEWIAKRDTNGTVDYIFSNASAQVACYIDSGSGTVNFYPDFPGTPCVWTNAVTTAAMHHGMIVFDESSNTAVLLIDGVSKGSRTTATAWRTTGPLTIAAGTSHPWDGPFGFFAAYDQDKSGVAAAHSAAARAMYASAAFAFDFSFTAGATVLVPYRPEPKQAERGHLRAQVDPFESASLRFGGDEADDRVALSLAFNTQIPGGFGDASLVIPRPARISALDAKRFLRAPTEFYGDAGRVAHQGRVAAVPQIGVNEIEFSIEGPAAHLSDDRTVRDIWIDCDLSAWGAIGTAARLGNPTYVIVDPSVGTDEGGAPALMTALEGGRASSKPWAPAVYNSDGIPIGSLYYAWERSGIDNSDTDYDWRATLWTTDELTGANDTTGNLRAAGPGTGYLDATDDDRTSAMVAWEYAVSAGWGSETYAIFWTALAVFGRQGLTLRGTASPNQPAGLFASDIIENAVQRWAPLLPIDEIEESSYIVRQFAKKDETDVQSIIEELTALGGGASLVNDWGYYEPGLFWKTPGTYGTTWRVRRDEVAEPEDEGPDATERCNGVVVTYQDPAGSTFRVGPPGALNVNATDASLLDTDPENPCNKDGSRTWKPINAGLTDQNGAILIGRLALLEANADKRKGTLQVHEYAYDEAGNRHPSWAIRGGDDIVVEDDPDSDFDGRRVISTAHDGADTLTASIGSVPDRLDALLGRLTIANEAGGF
jgi:hypothetical protein